MDTVQNFPGIDLTTFYLCPKCILDIHGDLECLPDHITEDRLFKEDEKEFYLCHNGHRSDIKEIEEGYLKANKSSIKVVLSLTQKELFDDNKTEKLEGI